MKFTARECGTYSFFFCHAIINYFMYRVEKDSKGNQAALLAFYPTFDYESLLQSEIVFLVDCSCSMQKWMEYTKQVLKTAVLKLPEGSKFNIWSFGRYVKVRFFNLVHNTLTAFYRGYLYDPK